MKVFKLKKDNKFYKVKAKDSSEAKYKLQDALNKQSVYNILVKHSELFKDYASQVLKNSDEEQLRLIIEDAIKSEFNMLNILQKL